VSLFSLFKPRHKVSVGFTVVYERVTYRTPRLSSLLDILSSRPGEPHKLFITVVDETTVAGGFKREAFTMRTFDANYD
jgi:hypothetical protein